jgi:hypothetical protein
MSLNSPSRSGKRQLLQYSLRGLLVITALAGVFVKGCEKEICSVGRWIREAIKGQLDPSRKQPQATPISPALPAVPTPNEPPPVEGDFPIYFLHDPNLVGRYDELSSQEKAYVDYMAANGSPLQRSIARGIKEGAPSDSVLFPNNDFPDGSQLSD